MHALASMRTVVRATTAAATVLHRSQRAAAALLPPRWNGAMSAAAAAGVSAAPAAAAVCVAAPSRCFSSSAAASAPGASNSSVKSGGVDSLSSSMLLSMAMSTQDAPADSQDGMVQQLQKSGVLLSPRTVAAMRAVDRAHYARLPAGTVMSGGARNSPYTHAASPIGQCSTISTPHAHAQALEALEPFLRRDDGPDAPPLHVLDVGSGSGYLTACMAHMLAVGDASATAPHKREPSIVVALEHSGVLLHQSRSNISLAPSTRLLIDGKDSNNPGAGDPQVRIRFVRASATESAFPWWPDLAPRFDVIHCGAAFATLPVHLLALLRVGGHMLVPVASDGLNVQTGADANSAADATTPAAAGSDDAAAPAASASADFAPAVAGVDQQLVLVRLVSRSPSGAPSFESSVVHSCSFAPMKAAPPEEDVDSVDRVHDEVERLKLQLVQSNDAIHAWHAQFKLRHQRKPNSSEMLADADLAAVIKELPALKRRVAALEKVVAETTPAE